MTTTKLKEEQTKKLKEEQTNPECNADAKDARVYYEAQSLTRSDDKEAPRRAGESQKVRYTL